LDASPIHIEEFLHAKTTAELIKLADPTGSMPLADLTTSSEVAVLHPTPSGSLLADGRPASPQSAHLRTMLASAAAVLFVIAAAWLWLASVHTYSTERGEQRTLRLPDGSTVELNTKTLVSVEYSRRVRAIKLLQGEAFFSVAHNPNKPFRVFVGSTVVEAVGTQFAIFKDAHSTRVAVVEGRVAVAQTSAQATHSLMTEGALLAEVSATPALLVANQAAQVTLSGMVKKTAITDVRSELSWREHRMSFDNDTIADVVAQFSRYSDAKIVLDSDVGSRRISGSCSLDPDSLLVFLENDLSVQVNRVPGGAIVRPR
jgi:transmembrane sensor